MDLSDLAPLAGPAVAAAGIVYTVVSQRRKANADALAKIDERVGALELRMTQVTGRVDVLPDRDSAHRLELSLSEVRGELKALTERIAPIAATSARLQEFLLEQVK
ncbi:hypothetical protein CCR97_04175 [Rhodoplanes elegans]|uniref:DUF2730 domain-containing protein n=1 Tax=Rhodoplanes elegans TaxID=29408 RepID=A0A327KL82_9BRAD|nr:DUF2730 family protein [Rhodoplanes elegans]MBK5957406.1 hypothetical protein [Rhodoplanes elegans]RAI39529.1 hypothetical protein CH338_09150 [Rhodoplanes elegans]